MGSRRFDVLCNGKALLLDFDVFAEAGGENRATVQEFKGVTPNSRSKIELEFRGRPDANNPMVNAIEILAEDR